MCSPSRRDAVHGWRCANVADGTLVAYRHHGGKKRAAGDHHAAGGHHALVVTLVCMMVICSSQSSFHCSSIARQCARKLTVMDAPNGAHAVVKRVALIRHGQGYHNAARGGVSWLANVLFTEDVTLDDVGQRQADALCNRIRTDPGEPLRDIEVVLCSPLSRTVETATRVFAALDHPPLELSPLCAERCLSTCDRGLRKSALLERWPHVSGWAGVADLAEVWWPANRTWLQEYNPTDRMRALTTMLAQRSENKIAVVGHAGIFACLTGRRMRNCEVLWCDLREEKGSPVLVPRAS